MKTLLTHIFFLMTLLGWSQNVSIWATSYAVVNDNSVTYYATIPPCDLSPTYQWYVNDIPTSTASSYTYQPNNEDRIYCSVTSTTPDCYTNNPSLSNIITMIVYTTGTPCAGVPTVVYGGKTYNTVQIGSQCWLRENINIGTVVQNTRTQTNNDTVEKYCYDNDTNYCNVYGGLYQWAEAVQYYLGVTNTTHWNPVPTGNVQGICPPGWHIPKKTESDALLNGLTYLLSGGKLKNTGLVHWHHPTCASASYNKGANNSSGFTMLAGGWYYNGNFKSLGEYGNMCTVTRGSLLTDIYYYGAAYNFEAPTGGQVYKVTAQSVRCLKD